VEVRLRVLWRWSLAATLAGFGAVLVVRFLAILFAYPPPAQRSRTNDAPESSLFEECDLEDPGWPELIRRAAMEPYKATPLR
jgi:hypothetical protein